MTTQQQVHRAKLHEFCAAGASGINFSALVDTPKVCTLKQALSSESGLVTVTLGHAVTVLNSTRILPQFVEVEVADGN